MPEPRPRRVVVSCEHAGHRVPARWAALFRGAEALLRSHRGWDAGAVRAARRAARRLDAPLLATPWTRLLADANRAPHNPAVLSARARRLAPGERAALLARVHRPHRARVEAAVRAAAREGPVLHLAVYSFAPRCHGRPRRCDVGLLYDPRRPGERALCRRWQAALRAAAPELRVRRNFPYRGRDDGLPTHLRRGLPAGRYLGVELELAAARLHPWTPASRRLVDAVLVALEEALAGGAQARGRKSSLRRPSRRSLP